VKLTGSRAQSFRAVDALRLCMQVHDAGPSGITHRQISGLFVPHDAQRLISGARLLRSGGGDFRTRAGRRGRDKRVQLRLATLSLAVWAEKVWTKNKGAETVVSGLAQALARSDSGGLCELMPKPPPRLFSTCVEVSWPIVAAAL
jgi:hypothetical protein